MFILDDSFESERENTIQSILQMAMGSAADSLENLIDSPVEVTEPGINWVRKNSLEESLSNIHLPSKSILMRQSFRGHLRGEMLIL